MTQSETQARVAIEEGITSRTEMKRNSTRMMAKRK